MFITFEGGEGAGKSTQVKLLAEKLRALQWDVVTTREPGGTPGAEEIRKLLVEGEPDRWNPLTEALLFMAARTDHIDRLIKPALDKKQIVISDRYVHSSIVYQGYARKVGASVIRGMHDQFPNMIMPDLTVILDIDVELGLKRALRRGAGSERFERFPISFHHQLRHAYAWFAQADPNCVLIDASQSIDTVHEAIWGTIKKRWSQIQ